MEDLKALDSIWPHGGTALATINGLTFGVHLRPTPGASRLFVAMSNIIGRAQGQLPSIQPLIWLEQGAGHVLSICDPTLYLDDEIEVGVFLGDVARDPIDSVVAIARRAAERLDIRPDQVIFWGVSGGGFGAAHAAMRSGGQAIIINCQESLSALRHWHVLQEIARVFNPGLGSKAALESHLRRTSLLAARQQAKPGYRILMAQNSDDPAHWARHYGLMCAAYGVDKSGGESLCGSFAALPYSSDEGHGFPPAEINRAILNSALDFFSSAVPQEGRAAA